MAGRRPRPALFSYRASSPCNMPTKASALNTVVPGQLHTPMVEARLARQRAGGDVDALLKSRLDRIPDRLYGRWP